MYFSVIHCKNKSSFVRGGSDSGPDKETLLQTAVNVETAN